jgi:multiple sugar transport system ATP-binding protein
MVFQSYALYPHMSVRDNLAFALKLAKTDKAEIGRRVDEAAKILDLGRLLDRKPKELSGGQRQRVALGRAIVREPKVFLMDEPLSNLDAKLRVQTRAEIARLHQRLKTTTVYVTHDQVEAMTMGNRIAVMSDGYLQQVGTPQELFDHPKNRFVAGFIGSPAMNFVEVTLDGDGESSALSGPEGFRLPVPPRLRQVTGSSAGRALVVGFRPEHLEVGETDGSGAAFKAVAEVVEYMGNDEMVHLTGAGRDLVAIVPSSVAVKPGDALSLRVPHTKLHLFDAESGDVLTGDAVASVA